MYIFAPFPAIAISVAKVPARLSMDLLGAMDRMYEPGGVFGPGVSSSPGGGGPGQSLTSTTTPPSIEEVGRLLNQRDWGRSTSYTKFNGKRPRCPSGYRWDKKRRKCVRIRKY